LKDKKEKQLGKKLYSFSIPLAISCMHTNEEKVIENSIFVEG